MKSESVKTAKFKFEIIQPNELDFFFFFFLVLNTERQVLILLS